MAPPTGPKPNGAARNTSSLDSLLPDEADLIYEEELLRNPYSLRMWIRYLDARKNAPPLKRRLLYERALEKLPGSYKLWHTYLQERRQEVRDCGPSHPGIEALNNVYERALVFQHKMPRIWLEYLAFLVEQRWVTRTRRAFDRALMALPITQHARIWPEYLRYIGQKGIPAETAVRVYRRYLRLEPTHAEEYIAYLRGEGRWGEAAARLAVLVNDEGFRSLEGKSRHALWLELCEIITRHPDEVSGLNVDAILRSGIRRFTSEVGRLWTSLADYYIRRGLFERARDIYEEGITSVTTVRDFTLIFDALTQFEEALISAKMEQAGEDDAIEEEDANADDFLLKDSGDDLDLRLARLEDLMRRRPELLSSVVLRQNPHNVAEWHKRAKLFAKDPARQIYCYTEAVKTVDPERASGGKPSSLWIAFARLYETHHDLVNAGAVFERATQARHKYVDDLAGVWCEWVEMEMRHKHYKKALAIVRRAATVPSRARSREEEQGLPLQERLYRSLRIWLLLADLEESLGTLDSVKSVYESALDLRIATPQLVLNYAAFLQEHKRWEDAFRVYERGVALFKTYPHARDIWRTYLQQFVERYGGSRLERARDLFREAVAAAPANEKRPLYLQYAAFEERHGLARNAMRIYDEALIAVPASDRLAIVDVYLARASEFFGIGKVREVYEAAIESAPPREFPDADVRALCVRYAGLEQRLGEVDRARAIFVHGSALADPKRDNAYWDAWNTFEVRHGNEETFREMLRVKRSVAASFSQTHFNTTVIDAVAVAAGVKPAETHIPADEMAALEAELAAQGIQHQAAGGGGTRVPGFVSAGIIQQQQPEEEPVAAVNPEDIELDDDEEDEDDVAVEQKTVPSEVFGSLAPPPPKRAKVDGIEEQ